MIKPSVAGIVWKYKDEQRITYGQFSEQLSSALGKHDDVSKTSVANWGQGTFNPDYWMLVYLVTHASGWTADFARDCLAVMKPEMWAKSSELN